jgi:hypothetical protein
MAERQSLSKYFFLAVFPFDTAHEVLRGREIHIRSAIRKPSSFLLTFISARPKDELKKFAITRSRHPATNKTQLHARYCNRRERGARRVSITAAC